MNSKDRIETKEIVRETILPYQVRLEAQNDITNITLEKIDKHLIEINGNLKKHDKNIDELYKWKDGIEGGKIAINNYEKKSSEKLLKMISMITVIIAVLAFILSIFK